jgi:hypothetical protein
LAGRRGIALFPFSREFPPFELGLDFVRVAAVGRPGCAEPSGIKTEKVADETGVIFPSCVRLDWSANRTGNNGLGAVKYRQCPSQTNFAVNRQGFARTTSDRLSDFCRLSFQGAPNRTKALIDVAAANAIKTTIRSFRKGKLFDMRQGMQRFRALSLGLYLEAGNPSLTFR